MPDVDEDRMSEPLDPLVGLATRFLDRALAAFRRANPVLDWVLSSPHRDVVDGLARDLVALIRAACTAEAVGTEFDDDEQGRREDVAADLADLVPEITDAVIDELHRRAEEAA